MRNPVQAHNIDAMLALGAIQGPCRTRQVERIGFQAKRKDDADVIKEMLDPERIFVIHHFLSDEECSALIRRSEALAYEPGTVAGVVNENIRHNERVIVDDVSLAADLFQRAEPFLPALLELSPCRVQRTVALLSVSTWAEFPASSGGAYHSPTLYVTPSET